MTRQSNSDVPVEFLLVAGTVNARENTCYAAVMPGSVKTTFSRVISDPVTIVFDGQRIAAARGEPVAVALVRAGKLALARSPKFHRPRGPSCLRAACDGCLARVDDCPNVMTCMVEAREGMTVTSQNTLGSREVDLLRMTDWFFPEGLNHHELFAGVPGVQSLMQTFARRVAGLGRLPVAQVAPRTARRREVDAVVVGSGPAGMAVASRLAARGRSVEVLDDALEPGGNVRALLAEDAREWAPIVDDFRAAVARGTLRMRTATTAGAFYGEDLLVVGDDGAEVITARDFVLATGGHDGVLPFEGNDVPGVMSARAAGLMLARGVTVGERVLVVVSEGGGPFGEAYARAAKDACEVTLVQGEPVRVSGSSRVRAVVVRDASGERKIKADALLVDAPRAPAYELCAHVGAHLRHEPRGFFVQATKGKIARNVWAAGEVVGTPFEPKAIASAAEELATQLAVPTPLAAPAASSAR